MTVPISPEADSGPRLPPAPLSQFIGREREVATITRLLDSTRLLTLTGAGGSGKTRLAREVAVRQAGIREQVIWLDLTTVTDPGQVLQRVAGAFGLAEQAPGQALALILHELGTRSVLLVLDGCEPVVDACAAVAEQLLRGSPTLTILATSREALGVAAETAWLVPPLEQSEAVELFVARGRSVLPSFTGDEGTEGTIAEICRRLDGIPLAIELAAARVRVISVEQIAERLGDSLKLLSAGSRTAVPRHRTIRATLDWSHSLLSEREQILLRRLAVFLGGFTIEAAEGVADGAPLDALEVLDLLAALVDKSLVVLDVVDEHPRYRLLETVRQYGLERLEAAGELESLRRRHAEFYLAMAEDAAPQIFGGIADESWLARLLPEIPNFGATAEWAAQSDERVEFGLRLSWALHWFWWSRGPFEETRRLAALLLRPVTVPRMVRVRAVLAFGHLNIWQGHLAAAHDYADQALDLLGPDGDPELIAYAQILRGAAKTISGELSAGLMELSRAIPAARRHSLTVLPAIGLHFQGICLQVLGDLEGADASFREEVQICRAVGNRPGIGHGLHSTGQFLLATGKPGEALERFREGLLLHRSVSDGWGIAKGIEGVAVCLAAHDPELAAQLLSAALTHRERIAHALWEPERTFLEPVIAHLRITLADRFEPAWAAGRVLGRDRAIELALAPGAAEPAPVAPPLAEEPAAPAQPVPAGGPDLVIRSLGGLAVSRRGEPIEPSAWGSARARELLVYLLLNPRGVTKDQVGQVLWPDATPAQLRNAFHVTLHRLRKALGHSDWIQVEGDRYRVDPALRIEFDATSFESQVPAALSALGRGDRDAPARLEAALAGYHGPFLDGESVGDWSLEMRDRLERFFVDGGLALARWLLGQGQLREAERLAARVQGRDDLNEEAWRLRMTALARAGERPQALKLYQQLSQLVARELDGEPDEETAELHERIQQGATV